MTVSDHDSWIEPLAERGLAVGFGSFLVACRVGTFAGGAVCICLLWITVGRGRFVVELLMATCPLLPYAIAAGALLSLWDRWRVVTHQTAYAELERARLPASRAFWSISKNRDFQRVARSHRRLIVTDWLVSVIAAVAFLVPAGLLGGLFAWATLYGTEALAWFFVWRSSLLPNAGSIPEHGTSR